MSAGGRPVAGLCRQRQVVATSKASQQCKRFGEARSLGNCGDAGEVSRLDVADMQLQVAERDARLTRDAGLDDADDAHGEPSANGHAPSPAGETTREAPVARCGAFQWDHSRTRASRVAYALRPAIRWSS